MGLVVSVCDLPQRPLDQGREQDRGYLRGGLRERGICLRTAVKGGAAVAAARLSLEGLPPPRLGTSTAARTVRMRDSEGGLRPRSRNHRTISPEPMLAGSSSQNNAKYAERISARSRVRLDQSKAGDSGCARAATTLPPPELRAYVVRL